MAAEPVFRGVVEELQEFFTAETGATVGGVLVGNIGGEFFGSTTSAAFGLTGASKAGAEIGVDVALASGVYLTARAVRASGAGKWFLYGVSIGFLANGVTKAVDAVMPSASPKSVMTQASLKGGQLGSKIRAKIGGFSIQPNIQRYTNVPVQRNTGSTHGQVITGAERGLVEITLPPKKRLPVEVIGR